jgi:hypothetical protein
MYPVANGSPRSRPVQRGRITRDHTIGIGLAAGGRSALINLGGGYAQLDRQRNNSRRRPRRPEDDHSDRKPSGPQDVAIVTVRLTAARCRSDDPRPSTTLDRPAFLTGERSLPLEIVVTIAVAVQTRRARPRDEAADDRGKTVRRVTTTVSCPSASRTPTARMP